MVHNSQLITDGRCGRFWSFRHVLVLSVLLGVLALLGYQVTRNIHAADAQYPRPRKIKMPADLFDGGTGWLNTAGPIELKDLKGKIVIVDFWTYCCINCMHVLPDLKYLEKKYPNELVVIGCHSAKFENEKESENIRKAILRYEIEHPVVNDSQMRIWNKVGITSWPSLLVIDAEGNACLLAPGEGNVDYIDKLIARLIRYHKANKTLDETPIRFDLERNKAEPKPLRFPGKLVADEAGNRLFISDSNHNRIVVTSLDGKLQEVIGAGTIGTKDGSFNEAEFDHPQGMALVDDRLFIADTENHLLRMADLKTKKVSTLAGTGKQARQRLFNGNTKRTSLNSPWDLVAVGGRLYIAMAGPHQIWYHTISSNSIRVYAGTGMEDIQNGALAVSAFAQPSGLATDGKFLYVCDSEGSAIRKVPINKAGDGEVTTIAGTSNLPNGASLFAFGDQDGVGANARFQHPLGIAYHDGQLYVADSYNHKIKLVDPKTGKVATWLGNGKPGDRLKPTPQFNEPAGLAVAKGKLYVADTNNHRILTVDLKTKAVKELTIEGLKPPENRFAEAGAFPNDIPATKVAAQTVKAGENVTFTVGLDLPKGYKLNPLYPASYRLLADEGQSLIPAEQLEGKHRADAKGKTATITFPLTGSTGETSLQIALTYGYCREGKGGVCKIKTIRWNIPLKTSAQAQTTEIALSVPSEE